MRSLHFFCLLLTAALTLLDHAAAAQNAPTPVAAPTGDKVLYGRHSARAGSSRQQPPQVGAQAQKLTKHKRKTARWQYQNQHRAEFPSLYRPGVE